MNRIWKRYRIVAQTRKNNFRWKVRGWSLSIDGKRKWLVIWWKKKKSFICATREEFHSIVISIRMIDDFLTLKQGLSLLCSICFEFIILNEVRRKHCRWLSIASVSLKRVSDFDSTTCWLFNGISRNRTACEFTNYVRRRDKKWDAAYSFRSRTNDEHEPFLLMQLVVCLSLIFVCKFI